MGRTTAWTFAVAAHLCWGYLAPGGKILLEVWPQWTLNAVRMAVSTLLLMMWFGRDETRFGLKALLVDRNLVVLGMVGIGLTFALYVGSLAFIEATAAAVLIFLAPFFTAILARVFLQEVTGWHLFAAASLTLVGAYLALFGLVSDPLGDVDRRVLMGIGINLVSVVLWAVYTVHLKTVAPRYPLGRLTIATFAAATVFFAVNAAVFDRDAIDLGRMLAPVPLVHMALYIAFPSVAAYLFYAAAIDRVGAGPITILLGLELLMTAILAHFLLGERFPPTRIAGLTLTTVAVVWFVWMQDRRERASAGPA